MGKEVKITEGVKKRAEQFQKLHQKGYSVKEAAEEMNICVETVYRELKAYAQINGKPTFEKPDRLYYIKEYKSKQQGVRITRNVISKDNTPSVATEKSKKAETKSNENETMPRADVSTTDLSQAQTERIDYELKLINECFESVENHSEYLLGILLQIVSKHTEIIAKYKEEAK